MAATKRKKLTHKQMVIAHGFKSGFEDDFNQELLDMGITFEYEPEKVAYIIPESKHTYTPDFKIAENKFIETKGIFSPQDRKKHLLIREQHPELDILIVFFRSISTLNKKSKTTYADWCDKNNLKWADRADKQKIKTWLKGT